MRVTSACLTQQSAQSVFESSPEASKADVTSTIEAENAARLVEMVGESDGSRVQPTHHGGVWGFVHLSSQFQTRSPQQQTASQIHNKSWRSGNLHHSAWVEGHTGGSRSIPHSTPMLPKWEEAVGSSQAPQPNKPNAHKSRAQLPTKINGKKKTLRSAFLTKIILLA